MVFEVPPDAARGNVRVLAGEEVAALDARVHSPTEVIVVASLLAKVPKFPLDMIDNVLLLADFLVTFEGTTDELHRGHSDMNDVYCELRVPRADELALPCGVALVPRCLELSVECASHDQGWASLDNQHDGTYNASFTWSEIAVVKQEGADQGESPPRQLVVANVRARHEFRHHLKRFVEPTGVVQHIAPGDTVQLVLRSQYPGWSNTANFARLRARFQLAVSEDAQLLTMAQLQEMAELQHGSGAVGTRARNTCNLQ